MKKQLLSTSAIALGVAIAAPASAAEWDVKFGGFMSQHVFYSDVSTTGDSTAGQSFSGFDTFNNSEIHFTPSVTLDNGITFGVNIQLEGNNNGGGFIDESYMTISGDQLGRIVIGNENSAGYLSMVAAPTVTSAFINSPSISGFLPFTSVAGSIPFRDAQHSSYTEVAGNNDVNRISYYTPSFNGLVVGVSYANNDSTNAGNNFSVDQNAAGQVNDIIDIGVNYSGSFGAVDVNVGGRYGRGTVTNTPGVSDPETWGAGASVSFGGFTIGGSYADSDNGGEGGIGGVGRGEDSRGWSLGATYQTPGPWSFEAVTYQGSADRPGGDDDYEAYRIGASRDLGPGVNWDVYGIYAEENGFGGGSAATPDIGDGITAAVPATAGEFEGYVIGTAINLSF